MDAVPDRISALFDEATAGLPFEYALYYRARGAAPVLRKNCDLFLSASIIKAPILFAWAYLERAGLVCSDEPCDLSAEPPIQGAGFSWLLRQTSAPYHDVLLWMMTVSDNLCANLVIRRVGLARLNATFRALGLPDARLERKLMDYEARARGLGEPRLPADCIRLYDLRDELPPSNALGSSRCCFGTRTSDYGSATCLATRSTSITRRGTSQESCTTGATRRMQTSSY